MRARNISTRLCTTRVGSRRSGNTRANLSAKPRRRSAIARSITPPFEVRRPPSKAAVTFLARTAGNENGRIVSSVMAGVAFAVEGDGVGFATESYAASALYTTLASLSAALWRIRRARDIDFDVFKDEIEGKLKAPVAIWYLPDTSDGYWFASRLSTILG